MNKWIVLFAIMLTACQPTSLLSTAQNTKMIEATLSTSTLEPIPTAQLQNTEAQSSEGMPINIPAFCTTIGKPKEVIVTHGTPINIIWGWSAKTEEQINDFQINNITTITLDGIVIKGKQKGGIIDNHGFKEVVWLSYVGILNLGDHIVTYDVRWKKMIDDGTSTYGPGGKNETEHDECIISIQ
jgi:hypothetical protein